jgi:hypothetical protein
MYLVETGTQLFITKAMAVRVLYRVAYLRRATAKKMFYVVSTYIFLRSYRAPVLHLN